jgi:hypothetical protein
VTRHELKHIAYCGLDCTKCPVYIATKENDDEKRRETAAVWNRKFRLDLKPEDINCGGCLVDSCLTERAGGEHTCLVHMCGREKGVINCAYCVDYVCGNLDQFFKMFPETASYCQGVLDGIRQGIK